MIPDIKCEKQLCYFGCDSRISNQFSHLISGIIFWFFTKMDLFLYSSLICATVLGLVEAQSYGGYGGKLGGYALGGSLSNFYGNCTQYGNSGWGKDGYGSGSTTSLNNCGFDADSAKVFGYYGYDFPKPPIGISYPNIGWPYSIPTPYYTPPPYGPIGLPYYGTPVHSYNPYLWGFGSYNGIYGAARGDKYVIPEVAASYKPSPVYKGYKFGPGGQIIAYY